MTEGPNYDDSSFHNKAVLGMEELFFYTFLCIWTFAWILKKGPRIGWQGGGQ